MDILSSIPDETRKHILVTGVERAEERGELLQIGFGDALSRDVDLGELEARARRVAEASSWLPRHRQIGPLRLDLLAREAFGFDRPLNLNPREFALLWRLAESIGQSVSKQSLVQDVWRMGFVPETNSIAVHMSRLRRKLSFVGLAGVIETTSPGYCLRPPHEKRSQPSRRKTEPETIRLLTPDLSEV
ncbi:MAG TPA: response regulator transcription factor [Novosphingobium sp.]|nr:response regulator transcription factor [Novosphingobium sp.]